MAAKAKTGQGERAFLVEAVAKKQKMLGEAQRSLRAFSANSAFYDFDFSIFGTSPITTVIHRDSRRLG
jgi:hypothetical protein